MRIEENRVFMFTFDTGEMGNIAIPVRGETRQEGAEKLQQMFSRMQTELAMEFPKVMPTAAAIGASSEPSAALATAADGLDEILLERIDTLMESLGAKGLTLEARAKTVLMWTELDLYPPNYSAIVHELELFASGAKEVPVKGKKK